MLMREGLSLSKELEDIIVADLVLSFAFTMILSGGILYGSLKVSTFLEWFAISLVAVSFSFVLHEMMHKFVAQHYGAVAAFRRSDNGLMITLITSLLGFLVGIPGATVIYAHNFTKEQEGYVSLAGPLTNFVVFAAFLALFIGVYGVPGNLMAKINSVANSGDFVGLLLITTMQVSLILAFFNMLPIWPLDGSKVLRWSKAVYGIVLVAIFALLLVVFPVGDIVFDLLFMLVLAFAMSFLFRGGIHL
jgi:Zn-dependent protease